MIAEAYGLLGCREILVAAVGVGGVDVAVGFGHKLDGNDGHNIRKITPFLGLQAALVLNASRRFRYTLDLKREEERTQIIRTVKANIQAIRAAYRFKKVLSQENGTCTSVVLVLYFYKN
ncbi:hypothetical protein F2P56_025902 [Juglans regia]|uniref:Calcium-transporting P-type ATPase N-terminal autoinhibitory domain-containing protein n=1 Tax=Juglans regia TaxID=51240 RepID=A0A833WMD1_JUGRE|nr:hypothetical protein F2P56_025902 [Juglans regia]